MMFAVIHRHFDVVHWVSSDGTFAHDAANSLFNRRQKLFWYRSTKRIINPDNPIFPVAVGIPAKVIMPRDKRKAKEFQPYGTPADGCPDPVLQSIESLRGQVTTLMERVEELEEQLDNSGQTVPRKRNRQAG